MAVWLRASQDNVLTEPWRLRQETVLRWRAVHDNATDNPANPDPTVEVRAGPQSWDEMFNGYFEWALAEQDLTRAPSPREVALRVLGWLTRPLVATPLLLALGLLWLRQRRQTVALRSRERNLECDIPGSVSGSA